MSGDPDSGDRNNSFAVVSYLPEPLAGFLNQLRQELVPNCFLRAHVTILPPRPNSASPEAAWQDLRQAAAQFRPFDIELGGIEVFRCSDVIYVSLAEGEKQLRTMHDAMNIGGLKFDEKYKYHPHITVAQDLRPDELDELVRVAKTRWEEFTLGRRFRVDIITFVQSTPRKNWVDLAQCKLGWDATLDQRPPVAESEQVLHG